MSNLERSLVALAVVYGVLEVNGADVMTRVAVLFGAVVMAVIVVSAAEVDK